MQLAGVDLRDHRLVDRSLLTANNPRLTVSLPPTLSRLE